MQPAVIILRRMMIHVSMMSVAQTSDSFASVCACLQVFHVVNRFLLHFSEYTDFGELHHAGLVQLCLLSSMDQQCMDSKGERMTMSNS